MQPVLFEPTAEEEEALSFSGAELRKRYTAEQVEKVEWKREAILMLLGAGWPVSRIETKLHVNHRTVLALARRSGEQVAGFSQEFADHLVTLAAGWFGLAAAKAPDAPFQHLVLGAGIAMTHARELKAMGLAPEKECLKGDVDRVAAAAELRRMLTEDLARQVDGKGQEVLPEASPSAPAEADRRAATPQPLVSCGVSEAKPVDITLEQKSETPTNPA